MTDVVVPSLLSSENDASVLTFDHPSSDRRHLGISFLAFAGSAGDSGATSQRLYHLPNSSHVEPMT
jgi:hypothetical protein